MKADYPLLSVIVPAYNGAGVLPRCFAALAASDLPRACWELIVVDDGSTDDTAGLAAQWADVVVRLPGDPHGPAYARNRGSEAARGDVLVFIDADVCVHPGTLRRFALLFAHHPELAAAFGSYDDHPPAPGLVSRFRNLLHCYHHRLGAGEATTFWAGCGAVRARAFFTVGRFDEWQYARPSIEDIELGHRLHQQGFRIVLRPEIECAHLKRWTLWGMLRTDLRDRGIPWMRMLLEHEMVGTESLNLRLREKVLTGLVGLALVALAWAALWRTPRGLGLAGLLLLLVVLGNLRLYRFLARAAGVPFALASIPLHLGYYIMSGLAVVCASFLHHVVGPPAPRAELQAFAEVGVQTWPPVPTRSPSPAKPQAGR